MTMDRGSNGTFVTLNKDREGGTRLQVHSLATAVSNLQASLAPLYAVQNRLVLDLKFSVTAVAGHQRGRATSLVVLGTATGGTALAVVEGGDEDLGVGLHGDVTPLQAGRVTAMDVDAHGEAVLSCSEDGTAQVAPLDRLQGAEGPGQAPRGLSMEEAARRAGGSLATWKSPKGSCLTCGAWATSSDVITGNMTGQLALWDTRRPGWAALQTPVLPDTRPLPTSVCGRYPVAPSVESLSVHPGRPYMCVAATRSGTVVLWDTRLGKQPVVLHEARQPVCKVQLGSAYPTMDYLQVFYSTQAGGLHLLDISSRADSAQPQLLHQAATGMTDFDLQLGERKRILFALRNAHCCSLVEWQLEADDTVM